MPLEDCAVLMNGRSEKKGMRAKDLLHDLKDNVVADSFDPVRESFGVLDPEGDGSVTRSELHRLLEAVTGTAIDNSDFRKVFEAVDRDDSGVITYEEYVKMGGIPLVHRKVKVVDQAPVDVASDDSDEEAGMTEDEKVAHRAKVKEQEAWAALRELQQMGTR